MINQKLQNFEEAVKPIGNIITEATVELYNSVVQKFLPTPAKIHYLFNLRDISKVFGSTRDSGGFPGRTVALQGIAWGTQGAALSVARGFFPSEASRLRKVGGRCSLLDTALYTRRGGQITHNLQAHSASGKEGSSISLDLHSLELRKLSHSPPPLVSA